MPLVYLLSDNFLCKASPHPPCVETVILSVSLFSYTVCYSIDHIVLNYFPFSLIPDYELFQAYLKTQPVSQHVAVL